ncbi:hypothetical protein PHMEG_00031517, partial [Phytophthora megakarya]
MPGGTVETDGLPTYPPGSVYTFKKMAGWTLRYGESEETSAIVCSVPANGTSVSQPLDVGVMRPLKKKLSAEWLREKMSATGTAKQKHLGKVMCPIGAWEGISA